MNSTSSDLHDDPQLMEIAREYLAALEAGRSPNRQKYLSRAPELADVLGECLDGMELAHAAVAQFGERADPLKAIADLIVHRKA